ncbi:MAG: PA14 domain-containing protein, partial [Planctomycetota bacterium]
MQITPPSIPTQNVRPTNAAHGIDLLQERGDAVRQAEANFVEVVTGRPRRSATYSIGRDLLARHTSRNAAGVAKASRNLDVAAAAKRAVGSIDDALIRMRTAVEQLAGGLGGDAADNARAEIDTALADVDHNAAAEFAGKRLFNGAPLADPIASAAGTIPTREGTGLSVSYFAGRNFEQLLSTGVDTKVHHNWGGNAVGESKRRDIVSVRWEGSVQALEAGSYQFRTRSDDGIRVWVDGDLVIDEWSNHGPRYDASGAIEFAEGEAKD